METQNNVRRTDTDDGGNRPIGPFSLRRVHEDERGSVWIMEGFASFPELTFLRTHAGKARGGCIHPTSDEHCTIIEGAVQYNFGGMAMNMEAGDSFVIPAGSPHYFVSIGESVVVEWGAKPEEKAMKDVPMRTIVNRINGRCIAQ